MSDKNDSKLIKRWKEGRWYSEAGEKRVKELYEQFREHPDDENVSPEEYCDNIRHACAELANAFKGIQDAQIFSETTEDTDPEKKS